MRSNNVGEDIRAMAQDVADLGAGYLRMGRRWLELQRNHVSGGHEQGRHRDPSSPEAHRPGAASAGPGPRVWRGGYGAGMDSYLDESLMSGYIHPADTQPDYPPSPDAAQSDYLPPGHSTFGRASYRGVGPKNYTRSDERITEDLCERLTRDEHIDPSDIEVNVSDAVVALGGSVPNRWMKHRIEDLAAACDGVRNVENTIQVRPPVPPPSSGVEPPLADG